VTPDEVHANNVLGRNIRRLRLALGWTQADLAARAEMGRDYVASLESGRIEEPGVHKVLRVAKALDVCMERLLGEPESFGQRDGKPPPN
jgi:transcriptional regulator with XRE-family HTH domain